MQTIILDNVEVALKRLFNSAITAAFPQVGAVDSAVTVNKKFADYQCTSAMALAKTLGSIPATSGAATATGEGAAATAKLGPEAVAAQLVAALAPNDLVDKCEVTPQGFINIFIRKEWTCGAVKRILTRGVVAPETPKERLLVDFSSPNIAKELHVGHLRSTIIGESLCRVFEFLGHDVARINHVGDWGTQFGMLILYMKRKFPDFLENPPNIGDLVEFYKASKKEFDADPEFKDQARLEVVKLQSYEETSVKAWQMICDMSRKEFQELYDRLQIKIDERGESFYNKMLPSVIEMLEAKGLVEVDDGAKIIISTKNVAIDAITPADMGRLMMYFVQTKKTGEVAWEPAFVDLLRAKGVITKEGDADVIQLSKKDKKKFAEFDTSVDTDKLASSIDFAHKPALAPELVAALQARNKGLIVENAATKKTEVKVPLYPIPLMVRKSDGGFSYDSTDLAAMYDRFVVRKLDRVVYVTDVGQFDHFKMVATAAADAGWIVEPARWQHAGFGLVTGEGGKKLATRSGETIKLKELLDEARDRSLAILQDREKGESAQGHSEEELKQLSRTIGYGAVKYFDLRQNRVSNYAFSFDKVLDLNGNTAVYLLYAYARLASIKRKAGVDDVVKALLPTTEIDFETEQEKNLALAALRLGPVVLKTAEDLSPKNLTDFAYELVQALSDFYNKCRVIGHEKQNSRLLLVEMVGMTLKVAMNLLGIDVAERL
jgi:arginyl-tRNA synthetase